VQGLEGIGIEAGLWLVLALVGLVVTIANLRESLIDLRVAVKRDPSLLSVARSSVRSESLRVVTMFSFAVAGAVAVLTQPDTGSRQAIVVALLIGNLALLLNSIVDRYDRVRALRGGV